MLINKTVYLLLLTVIGSVCLQACGSDSNDRTPSAADVQAADEKRKQYIESLNVPEATKQAMESQIGGNAPNSAAAGAAAAAGHTLPNTGRRF